MDIFHQHAVTELAMRQRFTTSMLLALLTNPLHPLQHILLQLLGFIVSLDVTSRSLLVDRVPLLTFIIPPYQSRDTARGSRPIITCNRVVSNPRFDAVFSAHRWQEQSFFSRSAVDDIRLFGHGPICPGTVSYVELVVSSERLHRARDNLLSRIVCIAAGSRLNL